MKYLNDSLKKKHTVLLTKYEEVQDPFVPTLPKHKTEVWVDFAFACKYISAEEHLSLSTKNAEVGKILGSNDSAS